MTFKDLLTQSNWLDVGSTLIRLFSDYQEHQNSCQMAYDELRQLKPSMGNIRLFIGRFEPHGLIPFYVLGFDGDCPKGFSLKFSPWEIWLGAKVNDVLLSQYILSEMIAICLYDMVWSGFSSQEVNTFRREFVKNHDRMLSVYALVEDIEASEFNPVKQKQRSNEIYEAIGLYDIDNLPPKNESPEHRKARLDTEVLVYCLGETETDYNSYCSKVSALREDFQLKWPNPQNKRPHEH